jgi:hypothetical protein
MITNVYATGRYIETNCTVPSYINPSNPSSGMLRYHNSQVQVYDGTSWLAMGGTASVDLTGEAKEILAWAQKKMQEEREAREMREQYPAVADAMDAVREAEEQLRTVVALCRV